MLVLSRKKNQEIVINGDITIVVIEIRGDKVRLGITASKEVPVHRGEVQARIEKGRLVVPANLVAEEAILPLPETRPQAG